LIDVKVALGHCLLSSSTISVVPGGGSASATAGAESIPTAVSGIPAIATSVGSNVGSVSPSPAKAVGYVTSWPGSTDADGPSS
jgi:hypothetical protein